MCNVSQQQQHHIATAVTLLKERRVMQYAVFKSVLILNLNFVHTNVNTTITKLLANRLQLVCLPPFW